METHNEKNAELNQGRPETGREALMQESLAGLQNYTDSIKNSGIEREGTTRSGLPELTLLPGIGDAQTQAKGPLEGMNSSSEAQTHMSQKEIDEAAKKATDIIGSGNMGNDEQRKQISDLLKQAANSDSLPDLIGKINEQLAKEGKDLRLSLNTSSKTELTNDGPTFQHNSYDVSLKSGSSGKRLDSVQFDTTTIKDYGGGGWGRGWGRGDDFPARR